MNHANCLSTSDANYINILFLNVRHKLPEVYGLVYNSDDVGVVLLGEVWIDSEEPKLFQIPNIEAVFNCRNGVHGGAIYVREDLKFRTLEQNPNFNN